MPSTTIYLFYIHIHALVSIHSYQLDVYTLLILLQAESFRSKPWFKATKDAHGYEGELGIEPHDLAPISNLILESMQSKGLALDDDMFTHGENPHGCGHAPRTVTDGLRTTSADFITKKNIRGNITVLTSAHVDKVVIENDGSGLLRATGVNAVLEDGTVFNATASKEVIISGGAYCSPNILNRSGIGAKADLEKHNITTLIDLPGVGKNLMDHLVYYFCIRSLFLIFPTNSFSRLSSSFTRLNNLVSRTTISSIMVMPSTKPISSGKIQRQDFYLHSPLVPLHLHV